MEISFRTLLWFMKEVNTSQTSPYTWTKQNTFEFLIYIMGIVHAMQIRGNQVSAIAVLVMVYT